MEAGDGAAGDHDEEAWPDGQLLGMLGLEERVEVHRGQHLVALGEEGRDEAEGHEDEQGAEEGVDAADERVDGQHRGAHVVGEDDAGPAPERDVADDRGILDAGEQAGGTGGEDGADHDEQDEAEDHGEGHDEVAEVAGDDFGVGGSPVAQADHAGDEVVHSAGEDGAEDDPEQGRGAVLGAQDGAEDRAKSGDVEELDEIDLPHGHGHVVHAVGHGLGGRGTAAVDPEDFLRQHAVDGVACDEQDEAEEEVGSAGHSRKPYGKFVGWG